ncbi:acyltransferase [Nonlabens mediterrranea]|uniref:Acyltransferase n=1 Tax=Nonlabens mediterrranea TaxID=1419947 RepID=A0ABS0AA11_9FLAO|nr:acyltransferase [Nonlabens mediterrranea]
MNKRVYGLDYLRGLCALLIAIYHLLKWSDIHLSQDSLISKMGIYGVAIFFALSGYALQHVYGNTFFNLENTKDFFKKRFVRIFPLLWVVITITLFATAKEFSLFEILLNYTGTFSLIRPDAYIAGGSWSIGVELVFYLLFPLLIILINIKFYKWFIFLILFSIFCYFAFILMDSNVPISENWTLYVNPLNQVLFFYSGMLLSKIKVKISTLLALIGAICLLIIMYLLEVDVTQSVIITGFNRVIYFVLSIGLVWLFASVELVKNKVHDVLVFLGDISYSLYLIHPLVYGVINKLVDFMNLDNLALVLFIKIVSSLFISYISFIIIEKRGKKLLSKIFN